MRTSETRQVLNKLNRRLPDDLAAPYLTLLERFDLDVAMVACVNWRRTRKGTPTLAQLEGLLLAARREDRDGESLWRLTPANQRSGRVGIARAREALRRTG